MPSGHAYAKAVRTVKTCVGTDFCRFGLGDAIGVGIELERAMEGLLHAAQGQVGGHRLPAQLRRGLRQGHRPRRRRGRLGGLRRRRRRRHASARATCWRRSTTADEAIARRARLPAALPRARRSTSSAPTPTSSASGIEAVREAVLDPDRQAELLERYRIAKAAADPDPWRERHAPVHPKQFAELDSEPERSTSSTLAEAPR